MSAFSPSSGARPGDPEPTTLLLIRHAQAAMPGDLRLPGPDLPLTTHGEWQARRLAARLAPLHPTAVLSSDALRARQTAEAIAAACAARLCITPALREINFGDWAGKTYAELAAADPAAAVWFTDPESAAPPDGESLAAAADRVLAMLQEMTRNQTGPVAVVGHAGSLRLTVAATLGMPLASYWRLRLDCATVSALTWTADGPLLERWNDSVHLDEAPA